MGEATIEKRRYIRHPSDIPIEIGLENVGPLEERSLKNVSFGGICFHSTVAFEPGNIIHIKIPFMRPVFDAKGRVAWCRAVDGNYDVGIEFIAIGDAFRARMVEQICHIEQYRREVREKEGRVLDGRAAALEWIEKYAGSFGGRE